MGIGFRRLKVFGFGHFRVSGSGEGHRPQSPDLFIAHVAGSDFSIYVVEDFFGAWCVGAQGVASHPRP